MTVDNIRAQDPSKSRQALAGEAKTLLAEEEAEERHEQQPSFCCHVTGT